MAAEINAQRLHVELDNMVVISMINDPNKNHFAVGPWIEEIKELLNVCQGSKVTWVRRTTNDAAHRLAKVGVSDELCKV